MAKGRERGVRVCEREVRVCERGVRVREKESAGTHATATASGR